MDILIRELEERDYPAMLSLSHNELGYDKLTSENIAPHYARVKNDNRYKTFVAVVENETVGAISSVWSFEPGKEVGFMHITCVSVMSKKQSKGIGAKLLKHMEEYAKSIGVERIILNTGVQRTRAHKFYRANGYENHSWCFGKSL